MSSQKQNYRVGLLFVVAAVVAWSTSGLFTRFLSVDTPTILFWRGLFGAVGTALLIMVIPTTGGLVVFRQLGRPGIAYAAVTSVSMLFFISALLNTTVAHVAIITAIVPFVAAFLGWIIIHEVPDRPVVTASLVSFVGVLIMVGFGLEGRVFGDVLAFLMALCMGGMILIFRRFRNIPGLHATCLASALSAIATLPFVTFGHVTPHDFTILVLFAIINQIIGFGLFALGARWLPPMETALITALDAPLAPLWVWIFLSETPGFPTLVGGATVLVAVIWHIFSPKVALQVSPD